jgi:hypothetical protein
MRRQAVLAAALGVTLTSCVGVYGPKGNDIGGIIPWSPEAERAALDIAQNNCGRFNKYAVITSIHRVYGDYISYACWWKPPYGTRRHVY